MQHEKHCIRLGWPGVESCDVCEAIRAAVAEQKERCAKIAEAEKCGLGPRATPMDVSYADGYSRAGDNIAAAIREQQL